MLASDSATTAAAGAVATNYDSALVAVSLLLAVLAGRVAFDFASHGTGYWRGAPSVVWLAAGASALGIGMWAMHFIGMLALEVPIETGYRKGLTALSVVPAVAGSAGALWLLQRGIRGWRQVILASLALATGIAGMHYTGMAAMSVAGAMRYDPWRVIASLVVAKGLAVPAIVIQARVLAGRFNSRQWLASSVAAIVLGLAIAGMHYTAMTAVEFAAGDVAVAAAALAPTGLLMGAVIAGGGFVMAGALVALQIETSMRRIDRRYRAILDSLGACIVVADPFHGVTFANRAARDLLGGQPTAIGGRDGLAVDFTDVSHAWLHLASLAADDADSANGNEATFRRHDGSTFPAGYTVAPLACEGNPGNNVVLTFRDLSILKRFETDYRSIFEHVVEGVYRRTPDGYLLRANPALVAMHGLDTEHELIRRSGNVETSWYAHASVRDELVAQLAENGYVKHYEYRMYRVGLGDSIWVSENARVVYDSDGAVSLYEGTISDISERKRLETDLLQAQTLEAVGQLASGIAHEINTPAQYVRDNLQFIRDALEDLEPLLARYRELVEACEADGLEVERVNAARAAEADAEVAFIRQELPDSVAQAQEGNERVARIVGAMKDFSHPDGEGRQQVDINRMIETTVTVARNEWKYVADLQLDLAEDLPQIPAKHAELSQAVLNVVINAAQAMEEQGCGSSGHGKGTITVATSEAESSAVIEVTDDGPGMPDSVRRRVFDPFYTTKSVGRGTGQGLAMARSVVADKHGGSIDVISVPDEGTRLHIELPMDERATEPET